MPLRINLMRNSKNSKNERIVIPMYKERSPPISDKRSMKGKAGSSVTCATFRVLK
jgi:hypothetical protein